MSRLCRLTWLRFGSCFRLSVAPSHSGICKPLQWVNKLVSI